MQVLDISLQGIMQAEGQGAPTAALPEPYQAPMQQVEKPLS